MKYSIEILRSAQKSLGNIDQSDQDRIISAIHNLSHNPRPPGAGKLSGRSAWRIRVGTYRIIYEIHDDKVLIVVVAIGHRRDIYRK